MCQRANVTELYIRKYGKSNPSLIISYCDLHGTRFAGVDMAFETLLMNIFGSDFIDAFKAKYPVGWVDLMIAFESRKRATNPWKSNPLNVALPFTFIHFYKKYRVRAELL